MISYVYGRPVHSAPCSSCVVGAPHHHHGGGRGFRGFGGYSDPYYWQPLGPCPSGYALARDGNCVPVVAVGGAVVSGLLPKTATDVIQLENQYDPDFQATATAWDTLFGSQPAGHVPPTMIDAYGNWKKFYLTWESMLTDPSQAGIFGTADDQYDAVVRYVEQLKGWQSELQKFGGTVQAPHVVTPSPPTDSDGLGQGIARAAWPVSIGLVAIAAAVILHR